MIVKNLGEIGYNGYLKFGGGGAQNVSTTTEKTANKLPKHTMKYPAGLTWAYAV